MVPGTSVVLSAMGAPFVSMFTMGRLILFAAGAYAGLLSETVKVIVELARTEPAAATTVTTFTSLSASPGLVAGKASWSAESEALKLSAPDPPLGRVSDETVIPEGKPVRATLKGPAYGLLLMVTVTGTLWSPG